MQSDTAGRAVFVNERWCALTGLSQSQAVGSNWLDLLRPADRTRIERKMTAQYQPATGQPEIAIDVRLRPVAGPGPGPDARPVRVRGSVVALREDGRPAGMLATFAVAEPSPAAAADPSAAADPPDNTPQFVATVSHELRTPLTSIISFLELIRAEDDGLSPDGVHFLDIIQRNANRLLRLVGNLLLLSRIESGISPPELAPVSVPELAREAVRDASAAAASFGVTLEAAAGDGPDVLGDHLGLTQVLENLIGNAVKFSHPGDTVRVQATWSGGTSGGSTSRTRASASRRMRWTGSSTGSSGPPTPAPRAVPVPAWACRWSKPSSRCTGAGSPWPASWSRAPRSASTCRLACPEARRCRHEGPGAGHRGRRRHRAQRPDRAEP